MSKCNRCDKTVYQTEKMNGIDLPYHKLCFRCATCKAVLTLRTFHKSNGEVFCKVHAPTAKMWKASKTKVEAAVLHGADADKAEGVTEAQRQIVRETGGKCTQCAEVIDGSTLFALDHPYHLKCFNCTKCSAAIGAGDEFWHEGLGTHMCGPCHPVYTCAYCKKVIKDSDYLVSEDKTEQYHKDCHTCATCARSLGSGGFYKFSDGKVYCEAHKPTPAKEDCYRCGRALPEEFPSVDGKNYHPECFLCCKCHCELATVKFNMKNDALYCMDDYKIHVLGEQCTACKKALGKTFTKAGGKTYHFECLTCCDCQKPLKEGGTMYMKGDQPICAPCAGQ